MLERTSVDALVASFPEAFVALDAEWRFEHVNALAERMLQTPAEDLLGCSVWERFPEVMGSKLELECRRAVSEQRQTSVVELNEPLGRWLAVRAVPVADGLAVWFHDVTEFKLAERRAGLQARVHEAMRTVATAVAAEAPTERLLQLVAERGAELVEADVVAVLRFEDNETYRFMGRAAPLDEVVPRVGEVLPIIADSEVAHVKATGRPVAVPDGAGGRNGEFGLRSTVVVPVLQTGEVWGVMVVSWREQKAVEAFTPWLMDFAELIAVALGNAAKRDELALLAATDSLTGLKNLRELQRRMDDAVARARRCDKPLTVALIDVDQFKLINDDFGHDAGDLVLRRVADVLRAACREGDVTARIGGDEFALLLDDADADAGLAVARRVRETLSRSPTGHAPAVTVSVGCAQWEPGLTREDLQRRADAALYWSKLHGRDQAWAFDADVMGVRSTGPAEHARRRTGEVADPAELLTTVRSAREFWRSALDALSKHIAVLDEHGTIIAVNAAWRKFAEANAGPTDAVGPGCNYLAACDAAGDDPYGQAAGAGIRSVLSGELDSFELLYPCHAPDEQRWFTLRVGRFAPDGPRRVIVHHQNVTETKLAQDRLKFQAHVLDEVDAAVVALAPSGHILQWNRAAEQMLGRTAADATGRNITDIVPAAQADAARATLDGAVQRGSWEGSCTAQRHDGQPITAWLRATRLDGDDGAPAAVLAVLVDITDKVRQAQALKSANDRLAAITASIGDGLLVLTTAGTVDDINEAATDMLGVAPDEVLGRHADAVLYRDHVPPGVTPMTHADGTVRVDDDVFILPGGTALPVSWTSAPLNAGPEGRGRVVVFRDATAARLREAELRRQTEALRWATRIQEALDQGRFVLFAQPIVDLITTRTVGEELLIRLREKDGTFISPGQFLPAAEEHGLMAAIDAWVVAQAADLAAAGRPVHFNLSGQSIGDAAVRRALADAASRPEMDPARLTVELTETALIAEADRAGEFVAWLRQLGYNVALDDFGTGYNSFARVANLPVNELKIDMSFVEDLLSKWPSESVVRAIVSLAADLGARTVAEGVEDSRTASRLRELGVQMAQGYHFGRPADLRPEA